MENRSINQSIFDEINARYDMSSILEIMQDESIMNIMFF